MVKSSEDLLSRLPWWQGFQPADLSAALTPSLGHPPVHRGACLVESKSGPACWAPKASQRL